MSGTGSVLTVARKKERCLCLGPGTRAVVWFHGCSKSCPHCIAKEMNASPEYESCTPEELFAWAEAIDDISGLTLSGGEPFEQDLDSLLKFLSLMKSGRKEYSVICFTGKTVEEIRNDSHASKVLEYLDVLIDGEYVEEQNNSADLRGSKNQRILFLTHRFDAEQQKFFGNDARLIEFDFSTAHTLEISGIPQPGFLKKFQERMAESGITINL